MIETLYFVKNNKIHILKADNKDYMLKTKKNWGIVFNKNFDITKADVKNISFDVFEKDIKKIIVGEAHSHIYSEYKYYYYCYDDNTFNAFDNIEPISKEKYFYSFGNYYPLSPISFTKIKRMGETVWNYKDLYKIEGEDKYFLTQSIDCYWGSGFSLYTEKEMNNIIIKEYNYSVHNIQETQAERNIYAFFQLDPIIKNKGGRGGMSGCPSGGGSGRITGRYETLRNGTGLYFSRHSGLGYIDDDPEMCVLDTHFSNGNAYRFAHYEFDWVKLPNISQEKIKEYKEFLKSKDSKEYNTLWNKYNRRCKHVNKICDSLLNEILCSKFNYDDVKNKEHLKLLKKLNKHKKYFFVYKNEIVFKNGKSCYFTGLEDRQELDLS